MIEVLKDDQIAALPPAVKEFFDARGEGDDVYLILRMPRSVEAQQAMRSFRHDLAGIARVFDMAAQQMIPKDEAADPLNAKKAQQLIRQAHRLKEIKEQFFDLIYDQAMTRW